MNNNITKLFCLLIPILYFTFSLEIKAQKCGTDEYQKSLEEQFPEIRKKTQKVDEIIYNKTISQLNSRSSEEDNEILTIPVVFHLIYDDNDAEGEGGNLTDSQVTNALQNLNDAFANANDEEQPNGVNIGIEFCLAEEDENGDVTDGIDRYNESLSSNDTEYSDLCRVDEDEDLKADLNWDPLVYMNVYVCREIKFYSECSGSVYGYSTYASAYGEERDGMVIKGDRLSTSTFPHEVGHYLNLYHTFRGDDCGDEDETTCCVNDDCLNDGDKVCDTPPQKLTPDVDCLNGATDNSCHSDGDDTSTNNPFYDPIEGPIDADDVSDNYLSYNDDWCRNNFTNGQRTRMRNCLLTIRSSMLENNLCCYTNGTPVVSFSTEADPGNSLTIIFDNNSVNADNYDWDFGGAGSSCENNPIFTFNSPGFYDVVLTAYENCDTPEGVSITQTIAVGGSGSCPLLLQLDEMVSSDKTEQAMNIESTEEISNGTVNYTAENSIHLLTGFIATSNSVFLAKIEECEAADIFEMYPWLEGQGILDPLNCCDAKVYSISNVSDNEIYIYIKSDDDCIHPPNNYSRLVLNVDTQEDEYHAYTSSASPSSDWEIGELLWSCNGSSNKTNISSKLNSESDGQFHLQPNPANDRLTILWNQELEEVTNIQILDISGRVVKTVLQSELISEGIHNLQVDVSDLKSGIYLCTLQSSYKIKTSKLVISK